MSNQSLEVHLELLGRDRASVRVEFGNGKLLAVSVEASGCSAFMSAIAAWRDAALANQSLPLPANGTDHVSILLRELDQRLRGTFALPYAETELCHCRAVPTAVVDRAIVSGCHTVAQVARMTSAGTSCGTCKPDTEAIIRYRLGR